MYVKYLFLDTEHATECLDHLQTMLWEGGDHSQDDEITSLICMLQSPLFRQLLGLQDSLQELEQVCIFKCTVVTQSIWKDKKKVWAGCVDPDQMLQNASSDLDLNPDQTTQDI